MTIDIKYVDSLIDKYMPSTYGEQLSVMSMYSLNSGGKRIRPIILLETASSLGCLGEHAERLAVALECIHTYSLVHDDLPCMDNDTLRRGVPTSHIKYGEANAVLCGDYLLNASMNILSSAKFCPEYFECIKYLYDMSAKMIQGQINDIVQDASSYDRYIDIALNKTGALLCASIVMPAILSQQSEDVIRQLEQVALNCGLIYQISDDLSEDKQEDSNILQLFDITIVEDILRNLCQETSSMITIIEEQIGSLPYLHQLAQCKILAKQK